MFSIYRHQTAMLPLQQAWEQADEPLREAILRASQRLDKLLQQYPAERGESRGEKTRILFQAPLAILFEVDEAQKVVHIRRAWAFWGRTERQDRAEGLPPSSWI